MWVAADRAFMLTSKMKMISALLAAERLRSFCSATQHRIHADWGVLFYETVFAETRSE
jgi:hypothetical protein